MDSNKIPQAELEDPNVYRDISLIDAYLDANSELEEYS